MTEWERRFKAAAVQLSPVFFARDAQKPKPLAWASRHGKGIYVSGRKDLCPLFPTRPSRNQTGFRFQNLGFAET